MKPLHNILWVLTIFIASQACADYSCNLESITKARTDLTNIGQKQSLNNIAGEALDFLNNCHTDVFPIATSPANQIEDFYSLVDELLLAQLKTQQTDNCIKLGSATTDVWDSPYKTLPDAALHSRIQKTIESCKIKHEKELGNKFSAEKCPLFGPNHKYSSAIAVPKTWKLNTEGPACLYLYGGKNRNKPEEEGIHLRENYPYLILLTMAGEYVQETYIDFIQGDLATKDFCLSGRIDGVDFLSTGGTAKKPLLRIRSYAEHCLRDSAAFAIDSVYKIEHKQELTPLKELTVTLHN